MRPLELTRRGVLGTLAVLVVAGVCIRLGIWQLDRLDQRRTRNHAITARMEADPVLLEDAPLDTAGLTYRRVTVEGVVDDDRAIVLAGRSLNGAPGVHLLSPFRLGGGAVLVNRGWLPAADGATPEMDGVRLEGRFSVRGVLLPFPAVHLDQQPDGFRTRWFRVDGDAIRRQYPYPVAPLYVEATEPAVALEPGPGREADAAADSASASGAAGGARQPIPVGPPALDEGPHFSYAIQWFSFAAIFLIGWIVLLARPTESDPG